MDGHEDDIFSCAFNYAGDTIITGSKDNTCRIWRDESRIKKDVLDSTPTMAGVSPGGGGLGGTAT